MCTYIVEVEQNQTVSQSVHGGRVVLVMSLRDRGPARPRHTLKLGV